MRVQFTEFHTTGCRTNDVPSVPDHLFGPQGGLRGQCRQRAAAASASAVTGPAHGKKAVSRYRKRGPVVSGASFQCHADAFRLYFCQESLQLRRGLPIHTVDRLR